MEKIYTNREEARKAGVLASGVYFRVKETGAPVFIKTLYDGRIDLPGGRFFLPGEHAGLEYPTVNELLAQGVLEEKTIYREADVTLEEFRSCRDAEARALSLSGRHICEVIRRFAEAGFNVSREAIVHNYQAWIADFKSGYRDDKGGYYLATPCGCNPLSFRATSLEEETQAWQQTYEG